MHNERDSLARCNCCCESRFEGDKTFHETGEPSLDSFCLFRRELSAAADRGEISREEEAIIEMVELKARSGRGT